MRHWLKFCLLYDNHPFKHNQWILSDFAVKRSRYDHVLASTIRCNIFHIRHFILINTGNCFSLNDYPYLKLILKGIKNKDPIPKGTIPLIHTIVKILRKLNQERENSWFTYVIGVMMVFAWAFMLRCSEYTKTPKWDAPKVNQIAFKKSKSGTPILKFKLDRRKTQTHEEIEPIAIPCTCADFDLCGYHCLYQYILECNKRKMNTPYLFAFQDKGVWKPITDFIFRRELKILLKLYYKKSFNEKIHRAHGFRYGGITDLGSIGIPLELIRRISGHAPDSKVLYLYLKLAPETVATLIKDNSKHTKKIVEKINQKLKNNKKWKF